MSYARPVVRSARQYVLSAAAGQTIFNFPDPLFDVADLVVEVALPNADFVPATGVIIALSNGLNQGIVTFGTAPRPAGQDATLVRLTGLRTQDRLGDVTRGGSVQSAPLETELDRQAIVLQELRRDISASLRNTSRFGGWNALGLPIKNLGAPSDLSDAVRLSDLQKATFLSGNVALPVLSQVGYVLKALAAGVFGWAPLPVPLTTYIDPMNFGAIGDGLTDDSAAIAAADAAASAVGVPLRLAKPHRIASAMTIASRIELPVGSLLIDNVTVQFASAIGAPLRKIFSLSGTGKIVPNPACNMIGFPEWFGAQVNTSAFDCGPALTACETAFPVTLLQGADYWTASTWVRKTSNRTVQGVGAHFTGANAGETRIVHNAATGHSVTIGIPGSVINNFPQGIVMRDVRITRAVPLTAPAPGAELLGPTGLHIEGALNYTIQRVITEEHYVGIYIGGTCQGRIDDCRATRSVVAANAAAGNDKFFAFVLDGIPNIGAAGGNASVFLSRPLAVCYNVTTSYGFFFQGSFVDTFVDRPESANCAYGAFFLGTASGSVAAQKTGNADLHVASPIFDGFSVSAMWFQAISNWGAISILGGYGAPGVATATAGVMVQSCNGSLAITQFQHVGFPCPSVPGMIAVGSSGLICRSNMWIESSGVTWDSTICSSFEDNIKNPSYAAGRPALQLKNGCVRNYLRPGVNGSANVFTAGVELIGSTNAYNEINRSGINPGAITTANGAPKLVINGAAVTSTGVTSDGTNVASGTAS